MIRFKAMIRNEAGIHCRPSAAIVKESMAFQGELSVTSPNGTCDLKSIMGLLALGLAPGERISVTVKGPGEKAFAKTLKALFEKHFDFPPRGPGQTMASLIAEATPRDGNKP
jgi:phosphocarrier protein HPr